MHYAPPTKMKLGRTEPLWHAAGTKVKVVITSSNQRNPPPMRRLPMREVNVGVNQPICRMRHAFHFFWRYLNIVEVGHSRRSWNSCPAQINHNISISIALKSVNRFKTCPGWPVFQNSFTGYATHSTSPQGVEDTSLSRQIGLNSHFWIEIDFADRLTIWLYLPCASCPHRYARAFQRSLIWRGRTDGRREGRISTFTACITGCRRIDVLASLRLKVLANPRLSVYLSVRPSAQSLEEVGPPISSSWSAISVG